MDTKVIAYYLPQYHEIPENNEWWGKGFTEWSNVKKAKPFMQEQVQPKVPLNKNYYNLLNKETVVWQTELARQYGIYGFCYFHYYFGYGKKLLEKPAENLLQWKDIDQKFCFFWANVSWVRTWSVVKKHGSSWMPENFEEKKENDNGILIEQRYGNEAQWEEHFNYLFQFFKDERYIKIEGKPFFAIYAICKVCRLEEMLSFWEEKAKEHGFPGLYIVSVNDDSFESTHVDAILQYGHGLYSRTNRYRVQRLLQKIDQKIRGEEVRDVWNYESIWKMIVESKPHGGLHNIPGGLVNYDETPRRGCKGKYFYGSTPQLFEKYMIKQLRRTRDVFDSDYLFLDAWNEWGEGNYLEPDETNRYAYLEALKRAKEAE